MKENSQFHSDYRSYTISKEIDILIDFKYPKIFYQ